MLTVELMKQLGQFGRSASAFCVERGILASVRLGYFAESRVDETLQAEASCYQSLRCRHCGESRADRPTSNKVSARGVRAHLALCDERIRCVRFGARILRSIRDDSR